MPGNSGLMTSPATTGGVHSVRRDSFGAAGQATHALPALLERSEKPAGLARESAQADEAPHLRAFLAATRRGMVATLRLRAEARQQDLLWQPAAVTERLGDVDDLNPTVVVSDQLAFGATLALRALERPHISFHPGHPAAIPGPGVLYRFPPTVRSSSAPTRGSWPSCAASAPRSPSASLGRSTTRSVS